MDILNLDDQQRPVDSLAAQPRKFVQGVDFDINNDRGIISSAKIRNFSFNNAQGGTAILGGQNDGNGVLQIENSSGQVIVQGDQNGLAINNTSGSTIVQMDSSGITVNDGKITIQNSSGADVLDSGGLVSSANFSVQTSTITSGTTTADYTISYDTVPNGTITLSRTRTTVYMIGMCVNCRNSAASAGETTLFKFDINGTQYGPDILEAGNPDISSSIVTNQIATGMAIISLAAGTSNLVLKFATSGAGTSTLGDAQANQMFAIRLGS